MSSNFLGQWGYTNGILRDDSFVHDFDYSPHPGSFGESDSNWLFQDDLFGLNRQSTFGLTLAESAYKHSDPEPMSPSSVATTPTTSEQPMAHSSSNGAEKDGDNEEAYDMVDDDEEYVSGSMTSQQIHKKIRRTLSSTTTASYADRNGRKKKYDAPPGVWRNSGGFISTVYINKKRVYGPLRRDVSDAVKDREEMLVAKSVINTEEGMRAFVQAMKERSGPSRNSVSLTEAIETAMSVSGPSYSRTISLQSASANTRQSKQPQRQSVSSSMYDDNDDQDVEHPSITSVRVSSRPLRAAAKRNIYVTGGGGSMDDDHQPTAVADNHSMFEDDSSTNLSGLFESSF